METSVSKMAKPELQSVPVAVTLPAKSLSGELSPSSVASAGRSPDSARLDPKFLSPGSRLKLGYRQICLLLAAVMVGLTIARALTPYGRRPQDGHKLQNLRLGWLQPAAEFRTLLLYVFSDTDPEYAANLRFFIREGMSENDGCDYIIIVQHDENILALLDLPPLPSNARFVFHGENKCFDFGSIGWLLEKGKIEQSRYRYFIFLNSSIRGPFMPSYWPKKSHWSAMFTSHLNDVVKLVGPTISCEGNPDEEPGTRQGPHVQSYLVATDQVGLRLLQDDGNVFACHHNIAETIKHSEFGASSVILNAGYSIDSLMKRYQGVDWQNESNWDCNARMNPYGNFFYDGISLEATEVVFLKVKDRLLNLRYSYALHAQHYDKWSLAARQGSPDILDNEYIGMVDELRMPKILTRMAQGSACFDISFYRRENKDLPQLDAAALWQHFVMHGQHEGRPFRYSCTPKVMTALEAFTAGQHMSASLDNTDDVEPAASTATAESVGEAIIPPTNFSEAIAIPTASIEASVIPTASTEARQQLQLQKRAS